MRVIRIIIAILLFLTFHLNTRAQDDGIHPQLWNNFNLTWNVTEQFIFHNSLSYNVLLSNDVPWKEFSYSGIASYSLKPWLGGSAGLYFASTLQTNDLRSTELRPHVNIRFSSLPGKKWIWLNRSRIEWRNFDYSEGYTDMTFRFRNNTFAAFSLIRNTLDQDNNLSIFSYFEVYHNCPQT